MGPQKRVDSIKSFAQRITTTKEVKEVFTNWDMELQSQPKDLQGRVLPPEQIFLQKTVSYNLRNADWTHCKSLVSITLSIYLSKYSYVHLKISK